MKDTFRICRKCGKPVAVITERVYRSILVDAEAVTVVANPAGETFVRVDGTKFRGLEVNDMETYATVIRGRPGHETAYRPHRCEA